MSLKSDLCKNNFNLFGMKLARVRETTALGEYNGHAYYANYLDSILDYKLWQDYLERKEGENYYDYLIRRCYAENINYINNLNLISYER